MIKYILFFYSLALTVFITVSGFLETKETGILNFQIIFLPVVLYFFFKFLMVLRKKDAPGGNLGHGVIFFSVVILIILTGTSINRIFFAKKDVSPSPTPQSTVLPTPTPLPSKKIIIVIEDKSLTVNIRKKATIYSDIIKKVEEGTSFDILEEETEWFKIKLDEGTYGYVSKKYAKLLEDNE